MNSFTRFLDESKTLTHLIHGQMFVTYDGGPSNMSEGSNELKRCVLKGNLLLQNSENFNFS